MSKELKPCPFCGSQATLINFGVWDYPDDTAADERVAMCSNTHCGVELEFALWNTRPIEDALTAEVDSLRLTLVETQNELQAHNAIMTNNGKRAEQAEAALDKRIEESEEAIRDYRAKLFHAQQEASTMQEVVDATKKQLFASDQHDGSPQKQVAWVEACDATETAVRAYIDKETTKGPAENTHESVNTPP